MRRSLFSILLLCAAVHCLTTAPSFFVPFNTSNDNLLYPNDDGYSTSIPFYFKFFGNDNSNAYVNTNGLISFAGPVSTFTPTGLQTVSYPMISAFWTDIDTRGDSTNPELNKLWYRVETDPTQINAVAATVRNRLYLAYTPSATQMLVATYYRVGYFSSKTDLLNTFQIVLMSDSRNASFVMLNYGEMQFYKNSGASIGASVGFSAGDHTNYVTLPNSNTPQIVDLQSTSNVGVPGQWIFAVGTDDFSCCFVNYPGEPSLVFEEGVPENVTILSGTAIPVAPTIIGKTLCTASNSTIVPTETSEFNDGDEIITRTWTVADTCGKIDTFTQVIRIINVIPVFTIPVSKYGMFNYTQPFNTENIDAPLVTRSHMYNTAYYTTNHTFSQGSTFPGWFSNRDTYRYDNGHQRDRNVLFLYGTDEETERSLGGSAADGEALVIAVAFQNFYTTSVQELLVSYTGEQWRRTSSPLNSTLLFQYRVVPAFVEGDCCGQSSENWTTVESLSFTSPVPNNMDDFSYSRLDGNRAFARREKSDILTVTVHPDEILYLRWIMIGDGGLDHYLSIEDFGIEFDFEFPSVPITPSNTIYNETFDIMSHDESEDHEFNSGMAPVYAWHSNIDTYRASYGRGRRSSNRTLIYSYGLTNETDRAIGGSCEQDGNFTIAVAFRNFNSQNISKAIVEYTGEEWRRDVSRNQTIMEFEYAVDTTATEGLCCNDVLVWTRVPSLDFTSPRVNLLADFSYSWLNGNLPANRRVIGPVTVNDMNVGYKDILYFRWRITSAHSENHFLSVDDFNVSFEFM